MLTTTLPYCACGGFTRAALLLATLASTGCYTYVPASLERVPIGSSVRTFLSTEATLALDEQIGTRTAPLSGRLLERSDTRVVLLVREPGPAARFGSTALYQRVDVAVPDVLRVDVRVLSDVRTGGFVTALLGAVTVAIVMAVGENEPRSPSPVGPNPVE
jgi:hypothetical protein